MEKTPFFSLIIPCYNEEKAIPSFFNELEGFLETYRKSFAHQGLEIIFVDNNSTDGSRLALQHFCQTHPEMRLEDCAKPGYGAAIKYGVKSTHAEYYGFTDLDCTYPLNDFIACLKDVQKNPSIDMVMTNRMTKLSEMPWVRHLGNAVYQLLTKIFFQSTLSDVCSGMRVVSNRQKTLFLNTQKSGLSFSIELTALALKKHWVIVSRDIEYRERLGVSKLSTLKDGFDFLWTLIRVKFFYG